MEESKKNAGFSLVELVIVIAIMAVLIAVLAPMYLKYVERSKVTTDQQIASAVHEAIAVAIADENIDERPLDGFTVSPLSLDDFGDPSKMGKSYTEFVTSVKTFLQTNDLSGIKSGFKSRLYKGQDIMVEIDGSTQAVTVIVPASTGDTDDDLILK